MEIAEESAPIRQKKPFTPEELLKKWLAEKDLEHIVIIGMPKQGGWKFAFSCGEFEFLAAAEGLLQKLKLNALNVEG
jgi:hypothetical protein